MGGDVGDGPGVTVAPGSVDVAVGAPGVTGLSPHHGTRTILSSLMSSQA